MPIVQVNLPDGTTVKDKRIAVPRGIDRAENWVREVRKVIPQVPNPSSTDWYVQGFDASLQIIVISLLNSLGEKCSIGILRESGLGLPEGEVYKII